MLRADRETADPVGDAMPRTRAGKRTVIVDPKGRDYSRYRGATLLTPNLRELSEAAW